jgi:hypothetical protein
MRIGLTFDEYVDLKWRDGREGVGFLKQEPGKPPVFEPLPEDDEPAESQLFPMSTDQAAGHLRSRGYDCRPEMLDVLVNNGVVKLSQPDVWTRADVDAAADYFEEAGIRTPYADMCATLGCSYADFLRPLREAAREASRKYRRRIIADDQLFVMHRVPPRGVTDEKGNLVEIKPAVISFTLCDDIRERLERGEEV